MKDHKTARSKGFTLIELLVVMGIIALLLAILLPALSKARATTKRVKDSTQIAQVHKGFLTIALDNKGIFPTPGLQDRIGDTPGVGAEDQLQNNHANMYSLCIMQRAFGPDVLVSPAEVSTSVLAYANYNYEAYVAAGPNDQFWDPGFQVNLTAGNICNTSYGTLLLVGTRKAKQWQNTMDPKFVVVGNRGVKDGVFTGTDYTASRTLQIHGGDKEWEGNVCFNDNHVIFDRKFQPDGIAQYTSGATTITDNIFKNDPEAATGDTWLTMCKGLTVSGTTYTPDNTWD